MRCLMVATFPILIGLAAIAPSGRGDTKRNDAKAKAVLKELQRMAGTWKLVFEGVNGQEFKRNAMDPLAKKQYWLRIWDDGSIRSVVRGGKWEGPKLKFTIDPTVRPKTVDLVFPLNEQGQKTVTIGIYELDGDELHMCFASGGHPRPTDFTFPPLSPRFFQLYRRVKDEK